MTKIEYKHLLRVSKCRAEHINNIGFGIFLHVQSGLELDALIQKATLDRIALSTAFLRNARVAMRPPRPSYRLALARSYYSIYHAARALIFFDQRGDDYEAHSDIFKHLPKDFVDRSLWENNIKGARLERNRADYDPYPKGEKAFLLTSKATLATAESFLPLAKNHLLKKGCKI